MAKRGWGERECGSEGEGYRRVREQSERTLFGGTTPNAERGGRDSAPPNERALRAKGPQAREE